MSKTIESLFAANRAWAAQMERDHPGFFTTLAKQQTPKYMWIGCSDSRVPVNRITGLAPGEVFTYRNVANLFVHSDLSALSAIQFAVDRLKVEHIMIVGHYGCGGVRAALENSRIGLADNWLRHIRELQYRHREVLKSLPEQTRSAALVELNVIEQVLNVCVSTVVQDAWASGQKVNVHGWVFCMDDGLLRDLSVTINSLDSIEPMYLAAIERVKGLRE